MKILKILFYKLSTKGIFNWMSDSLYLKIMYKLTTGSKLNIKNPSNFNEKIQWLKLNDRNPEYIKMVDKFEVKKYVAEHIGDEYIIPTLGIYNTFDEIDFDKLPNQFVMKCTHDSGGIVICKDKSQFCIKKARKKFKKLLKNNFYYWGREWPYKYVKPRIIIEKYMVDEEEKELKDYKLFCFNGKIRIILVCSNRFIKLKKTYFDDNWNKLDLFEGGYENEDYVSKPDNLERMKQLATELSKNMKFVRVDFYEINHKIFFGEITFYPANGFESFEPKKYNDLFGSWIQL